MLLAQPLLLGPITRGQHFGTLAVQQIRDDADDAGRVEHVYGRAFVRGRDPHGGVLP